MREAGGEALVDQSHSRGRDQRGQFGRERASLLGCLTCAARQAGRQADHHLEDPTFSTQPRDFGKIAFAAPDGGERSYHYAVRVAAGDPDPH